jgi:formate hydrogenlyase subunit 6/NADH:ubiquinone oxidoreductase subunit I
MAKTITEQNLRLLVDSLVKERKRVVGPKQAGTIALYEPLAKGEDLVLGELPKRSAKEAFFPLCENILSFRKTDEGMAVTDVEVCTFPETVVVGLPPCDAAGPGTLDAVFSWDYRDEFYLERRRKTTIVGIGCTSSDDACFCGAVGLSPADTTGSDLFLTPLEGGGYAVSTVTEKGEKLLAEHVSLFTEKEGVTPKALPETTGKLDLPKIRAWLKENFESELWEEAATRCAGCGACAFVCPVCHCFDIVDEGGEEKGERRKFWDACGFGKFTLHASAHNPRDAQPKRYRNRIMHKFLYYDEKFGKTLCTGCGRCVRACPVGIDINEILQVINNK